MKPENQRNMNFYQQPLLTILVIWIFPALLSGQNPDIESCRQLADLAIEDTNLLSATVVEESNELPEYCRVLGYVRPAINFEIRLPTSGWNGKFYMAGCGAFCGRLNSGGSRINNALKRAYAVSTTDGGHWGETVFDGRWAYHNPQAEIDWGYRAVHQTARVTKVIVEAFYEQHPDFSYFDGCSNGGRQAVMEALRYPEDFDGIISRDPALEITKGLMSHVWQAQINIGPNGNNILTSNEVKLLAKAVYDACDEADGLKDGLISNPEACNFDPSTLRCDNIDETNCLSQAQVEVVQALYQGPIDSKDNSCIPVCLMARNHFGQHGSQVRPKVRKTIFFQLPDWSLCVIWHSEKMPLNNTVTQILTLTKIRRDWNIKATFLMPAIRIWSHSVITEANF